MIWAGLKEDGGYARLGLLFRALEDSLAARGFEREPREYSPHLTFARVRDDRSGPEYDGLRETVERLQREFGPPLPFDVSELVVFRSDLSPKGPKYTALSRAPLRDE